mmetsp:Transcript_12910/g.25051  ORF Transcript_12910/g.25051 Transcript_12910/m.25051 type:complete len:139 (+) Transcript_12910:293-709(+)|eukprot:CAMPEP_0171497300 /NCGR_PEP_ID=MMETSP0958-20121227/7195_1 /TAXON_ID=87120 /ORGANISM="Aurantiochytrium limacinum, Strain ATCCMYA-1381" /LENGTH=138 /DNA_ID=CAMNT_0012031527 /DNA_START=290 /DNA_END=706 /DNA_ORIENTATION=-
MPRGPRLTAEERETRRVEMQRKQLDLNHQLDLTKDFIMPKRWEELSKIAVRRIQENQYGDVEGVEEEEDEDGSVNYDGLKKRKNESDDDSDDSDDSGDSDDSDDDGVEEDANGMVKKKDGKKKDKKKKDKKNKKLRKV